MSIIFSSFTVSMSSHHVQSVGTAGVADATDVFVLGWNLMYEHMNKNQLLEWVVLIAMFLTMSALAILVRWHRTFAATALTRCEINEDDLHIPLHHVKQYQYDRVRY